MVGLGRSPASLKHGPGRRPTGSCCQLGQSGSGFEAFRWTEAIGIVKIGDLPVAFQSWCFSSNGSIIVGNGTADTGSAAFV